MESDLMESEAPSDEISLRSEYTFVAPDTDTLFFRPPTLEDLDAIFSLEAASYPVDEAATYEKMKMRIEQAADVFLVAMRPDDPSGAVVGFVCGTRTAAPALTHASMSTHDPDGPLLCVHSVVVDPGLRRKGLARKMLRAYLRYIQATSPDLTEVRLLSKENLVKLYQGAGFDLLGPSDVCHGSDVWMELKISLPM